jgi:hypothetical protein
MQACPIGGPEGPPYDIIAANPTIVGRPFRAANVR